MLQKKPRGVLRILFRLPIYLYRLDLGWVLGYRFLMVTHQGRKSGLLRQTVLEVVHYDSATSQSIVVAALGEQADWYRNVQAAAALEVQTGRLRYVPDHHFLTPDATYDVWTRFERKHPREASIAVRLLGWTYDGTEAGRRRLAGEIRLVAFRPRGKRHTEGIVRSGRENDGQR